MTLKEWLVIVTVSRTLSLITSTASGAAAGRENYLFSVIMFALTAMLSAVGIMYYRRICAQEKKPDV